LSLFNMAATSEDDDVESTMPEHQIGSNALLTANPKRISFVLTLAKEVGLNEEQIRTMVEKKYNVALDKLNNGQIGALINLSRSKKQNRNSSNRLFHYCRFSSASLTSSSMSSFTCTILSIL
jgi:carbamate kinase